MKPDPWPPDIYFRKPDSSSWFQLPLQPRSGSGSEPRLKLTHNQPLCFRELLKDLTEILVSLFVRRTEDLREEERHGFSDWKLRLYWSQSSGEALISTHVVPALHFLERERRESFSRAHHSAAQIRLPQKLISHARNGRFPGWGLATRHRVSTAVLLKIPSVLVPRFKTCSQAGAAEKLI